MSDQTPDDAARAEAERLYPQPVDDEELTYPRSALRQGKRDAYLRGRADERARIAARRDEAYRAWCEARKGAPLVDGEFEAIYSRVEAEWMDAVLAALGMSDTHRCDNCEGVDPASCLTRSDR